MKIVYWSGTGNTEKMAKKINGKKVALFGDYSWSDGQCMKDRKEKINLYGCELICDGLIIQNELKDNYKECIEFGNKIARA